MSNAALKFATTNPIRIDRGIPVPGPSGRAGKYPFRDMRIGDSFFVENSALRGGIYSLAKRHGLTVRVANEGTGFRVWRIA